MNIMTHWKKTKYKDGSYKFEKGGAYIRVKKDGKYWWIDYAPGRVSFVSTTIAKNKTDLDKKIKSIKRELMRCYYL